MEIGFSPTAAGKVSGDAEGHLRDRLPGVRRRGALGDRLRRQLRGVVVGCVTSDGFPAWYQDGNGVRVVPCLDLADPRCVVLAGAGFDPV